MAVRTKTLLAGLPGLLLAACATSGLHPLVFEGSELHASLATRSIDDRSVNHVARDALSSNPQVSTEPEFVAAIARSGSQGALTPEGIRGALYALYVNERGSELGFYGLEAASTAEADRLEEFLRRTWAFNAKLHRARVHRGGLVILVIWNEEGVSRSCWEAVNAAVAERLAAQ